MAYEEENQQPASAALDDSEDASEDAADNGADEAQEGEDNTFYLPGDFPGAANLKAGDTVTLRVVGKDADGDIQVETDNGSGSDSNKPIMQDFEDSMK
jgi:hypothetical protein